MGPLVWQADHETDYPRLGTAYVVAWTSESFEEQKISDKNRVKLADEFDSHLRPSTMNILNLV